MPDTLEYFCGLLSASDVNCPITINMRGYELISSVLIPFKVDQQDDPLLVVTWPLVEDKVSQPVENRLAVYLLHSLYDVCVVSHYQIRPSFDQAVG